MVAMVIEGEFTVEARQSRSLVPVAELSAVDAHARQASSEADARGAVRAQSVDDSRPPG
jgi:hypothetical protein